MELLEGLLSYRERVEIGLPVVPTIIAKWCSDIIEAIMVKK